MKYDQALAAVLARVARTATEEVLLFNAHERALAREVSASVDLPGFDNSAMDGYAVRAADTGAGQQLRVVGEVATGHAPTVRVEPGCAVRIFTGAAMPPGADAVVRQERVRRSGGQTTGPPGHRAPRHDAMTAGSGSRAEPFDPSTPGDDTAAGANLPDPSIPGDGASPGDTGETIETLDRLEPGADVRPAGSDVRAGDKVMQAGVVLDAGRLALLGGLGFGTVPVYSRPRVVLLATGSEVVAPGRRLGPCQVWDANTVALSAQARDAGAEVVALDPVGDDVETIAAALETVEADVVVTTAGVSVGDYDAVHEAFERLGVETVFWRLAIRPGKPVRFGVRGATLFFGLPGNPLAAQTTFETLVRPALLAMLGLPTQRPAVYARLTAPIDKRRNVTYFNRGHLAVGRTGFTVTPTSRHGSGMLGPSAEAGALLWIPEGAEHLATGAPLRVDILRADAVPFPSQPPRIVAICAGGSNSGKTLWVCALVGALTRRGLRVGTIKHTHKDFDVPGKDSAQHRDAGAKRVILSAFNGRSVLVPEPETSLADLVATELADMDLAIAEGFRSAGPEIPKLFVGDAAAAAKLDNVVGVLRLANAPIDDGEADSAAARLCDLLGLATAR